jgi:hypothetical protein
MTAKTETYEGDIEEWDIEYLRRAVGAQLTELRSLLYRFERSGTIDIYAVDVIEDLSFKLEGVLYCGSKCHHCVDPLRDAHDLARDIARVGSIVHADDVTAIGERVAWLIYDYAQENEELWESDE